MRRQTSRKTVTGCAALTLALCVWFTLSLTPALALEPPRPGELPKLKAQGKLQESILRAKKIGNHRADSDRLKRAADRLRREFLHSQGFSPSEIEALVPAPPPAWEGMASVGNVKVFALLLGQWRCRNL